MTSDDTNIKTTTDEACCLGAERPSACSDFKPQPGTAACAECGHAFSCHEEAEPWRDGG